MSVKWTDEQKRVIDTRGKNLLVSAAAGSGKTAVLVERILSLITDPERKVDVDHLLITTFTKAAAAEMKERISRALGERIKEEPDNEWLQRQEALAERAQITTIHGFCLYVIRNYFYTIDLNPNFRIADEGEMQLLKQDVVEEVLEEAFEKRDPAFLRFAESYAKGNRGNGLDEMVLRLYEYAIANPQPEKWLHESAMAYEIPKDAEWAGFFGSSAMQEELRTMFADLVKLLEQALEIARAPYGPLPYEGVLLSDMQFLDSLQQCETLEQIEEYLAGMSFKRLPAKNTRAMKEADEELSAQAAGLRDEMKESLKKLQKQYFSMPKEVLFDQMRETGANVQTLISLTLTFLCRLEERKRQKNILDFSDQEHLALRILTREENGELVPSQVADVFADYFAEIMVDEYQDSNLVQEEILKSISGHRRGKENRFMVGDVKQSIYRFRQAEPGLFLEKYNRYQTGAEGMRIDLDKNFRSRGQVLDPVNEIFYKIMRPELGGIDYDVTASLKVGAEYPENPEVRAELLLLSEEDWDAHGQESRLTKIEMEAHLIASRIRHMLEKEKVTEDGKMRPVRLGDMVILLRTMAGWSEVFVRILQEEGIPAVAQSREGYFQTMEVETLLAYLRVLDNPTQEIPLASALHSFLGGFSSTDMANIKAAFPEDGFARSCVRYQEEGEDETLRERLRAFYEQIRRYRQKASYTSIHELLWQIVTETGYLDEVQALPGGRQRLANVEMLLQKARDFEKISYHGLFHFIRYIEKMQKYQMDFGEASITAGDGDAVRIMSIHHSKGLEFPVIFVAGLGKKFNRMESTDPVLLHREYGIGLDYVDLENRMHAPTLLKKLISRKNMTDSLGEELRVLYVALTRAREKLILTGMAKEKQLELLYSPGNGRRLSYSYLIGAQSSMDWLLAAIPDKELLDVKQVSCEQLIKEAVKKQMETMLSREELERTALLYKTEESLLGEIDRHLNWKYPWDLEKQSRQKYSVTELKKLRMAEESESAQELYQESDIVPLIPQFIEKTSTKTGAARGTVYHTIMEWMDLPAHAGIDQVVAELTRLKQSGKLEEEDLAAVNPMDFVRFLRTDLAERMLSAKARGVLYREQPFVIGVPSSEVEEDGDPEETVLIQGIIDAFFYEKDEIVILDYKTDKVYRKEDLAEKYHAQLLYYQQALEMMTGKCVKEKLIYSFELGDVIKIH